MLPCYLYYSLVFGKVSEIAPVYDMIDSFILSMLIELHSLFSYIITLVLRITLTLLHTNVQFKVNKAVIAVPAKFSQLQRQATAQAYKDAGLKVSFYY